MDSKLEIPLLKASEENADECSKTFQDNNETESDEGESEYYDDESAKSDDVFFEDISSSLINIHRGKVNGTTGSTTNNNTIYIRENHLLFFCFLFSFVAYT